MNKRTPFIIGLIVLSLSIWVQFTSISLIQSGLNRLEHIAYDLGIRASLHTFPTQLKTQIAIVDIDDKSLKKEGRWPWPRSKLALLVQQLKNQGAVVLAFDILFPENETNITDKITLHLKKASLLTPNLNDALQKIKPDFESDVIFANTLSSIDAVLGMTFIPKNMQIGPKPKPIITLTSPEEKQLGFMIAPGYITDIPLLQKTGKTNAFINVFPDPDGIIRRVPLLIRYQNDLYPSLALEAVRVYLLETIKLIFAEYKDTFELEGIQLGKYVIPTDDQAQVIVPYIGKSYTFPYLSATDILNKKIPDEMIQGKIIFIGTSAAGMGDLHATTVQEVFPGVEIHASIAEGILQHQFSYQPTWVKGVELLLTLAIGLFCVFTFPYLGPIALTIVILFIPTLCIIANNLIWNNTGLIIPILIPAALPFILAMTNLIYGYLFESRRREALKEMFGQYVPKKHIDEMLFTSGKFGLHGEDREMTVLFADIRNFTTISEPLSAAQLKQLLQEFFTPMTEIIFKHHGTIDKYVGDLIMAFWNAPMKDKHHARHAIEAALEMQKKTKLLQEKFVEKHLPVFSIGIGINTGMMSVGDMGSTFRKNYTVIGDAVNLASRAESLSKYYGAKIVVTEHTIKNQTTFIFRQLDRVKVKGKIQDVILYDVICNRQDLTEACKHELMRWHQGLKFYYEQKWEEAETIIAALNHEFPHTKLYSLYLARVAEFKKNPPPESWDGIFEHVLK